jgi:aldehyde:ferredoxin oxidoreductase
MIQGYAGKVLEVDLTIETATELPLSDDILREYIGGRGLATKILWDRLGPRWDTVDPLGPDNVLLLLAGPLTGFFPGGRICVSGKSPQNSGVIGSTVGGEFGVELRCSGYDGLVVTGKAETPCYIFITDGDVEIRPAGHIWGEDAKETVRVLTKEGRALLRERFSRYGAVKEPAILYIGPAGENTVRTAVVASKWTHAAGYGGYGAVMGSKNLKAVAVKGTGPLPKAANMERVKKLVKVVCANAYESELWRRWGTGAAGYEVGAKTSSEPVCNWQEEWHDERSFGVDQFENRLWIKQSWADFGCPTCCLKIAMVKTGKFKGAISDNPDYELQAYLGSNLGIFTPEDNVFLTATIDDLGLCGIQTGNVLGFVAELFQRGILTRDDLDGVEPKWGDTEAFAALARKIAFREGVGDLLAEGTYRAALRIAEAKKMDVLKYAVHAKGIGIGAHGIRSGKDYPHIIAYACSVQGGDHTSTAALPLDSPGSEIWEIFNDSAVYCNFNGFGLKREVRFDFYRAITGLELTPREWISPKALRILQLQRAMLLLGGPDLTWNPQVHDDNPVRFYEPLPSGPYTGKSAHKVEVDKARQRYYEEAGWDKNGVPTSKTLHQLGLQDVDDILDKIRTNPGKK